MIQAAIWFKQFKNEITDVEILTESIKSSRDKIEFKCRKCGAIYKTTKEKILKGESFLCLKCKKGVLHTKEEITKKLDSLNIKYPYQDFTTNKIKICCNNCGKIEEMGVKTVLQGQTLCRHCRRLVAEIPSIATVRKEVEKRGSTLLSTEYRNNYDRLWATCSVCGKPTYFTWRNLIHNKGRKIKCLDCNRINTEELAKEFSRRGSKLLTKDVNSNSELVFTCSKCSRVSSILYRNFISGQNKQLRCEDCNNNHKWSIEEVEALFSKVGTKLLSKEYINQKTKLDFKCPICGNIGQITLNDFLARHKDSAPLCQNCSRIYRRAVVAGSKNGEFRKNIDITWFKMLRRFWGVDQSYSIHHIKLYSEDISQRTSLTNGYPIKKEIHSSNFILNNIKNPCHRLKEFDNLSTFPDLVRLPYHTYDNFRFLDLQSKVITEIVDPMEAAKRNSVLQKKINFAKKGILYIPIFIGEAIHKRKQDILISMTKFRLYKYFKDIYKFTGTTLNRFQARKLEVAILSSEEAFRFYEQNHIQGGVRATINLGFKDINGQVIQAMSFSKNRFKSKDSAEWELIRLATKINTSVIGGANKLFEYFKSNYYPNSILSFCDIRFSSLTWEATIYPKLGFNFIDKTRINYKYFNNKTYALYSRQNFTKANIEKFYREGRLGSFNKDQTEQENMLVNGFIPQYDCGSFKFEWRK